MVVGRFEAVEQLFKIQSAVQDDSMIILIWNVNVLITVVQKINVDQNV